MSGNTLRLIIREFINEAVKKKPSASVVDILGIISSNKGDSFEEIYKKVSEKYSNSRKQVKSIFDRKGHGDADPRSKD